MGRAAQAFGVYGRRLFRWGNRRTLLCAAACLPLAACGAKGFSIEAAVPDRSTITGSIARPAPASADPVSISDEATIRNAVSSAIVDEIGEDGLGWANAGTGSRGAIREVREARADGYLCRRFTASRESFSGVHLYRGETCLGPERLWIMKSFDRVE